MKTYGGALLTLALYFNFNSTPKDPYTGFHPLDIEIVKNKEYINRRHGSESQS
jgi:hypothetical protein